MKILITGSRDWIDEESMRTSFNPYLFQSNQWCHGAARGADTMAGFILKQYGEVVKGYPVQRADGPWPAAGIRRNERMFDDFRPNLVLAFPLPQSRGTVHMINYAKSKGCEVVIH